MLCQPKYILYYNKFCIANSIYGEEIDKFDGAIAICEIQKIISKHIKIVENTSLSANEFPTNIYSLPVQSWILDNIFILVSISKNIIKKTATN